MKNILTQGSRWELTGEASNNPTMVLTILDQGKSFPPFSQLIAHAIAENMIAVINGHSSKPIPSGSDEFEITKRRLDVCLNVKPEKEGVCNEVILSRNEGRDMAEKIFRVIQ